MKSHGSLIRAVDECCPQPEQFSFWWLGQMGYILKMGRCTIYIDVFLSEASDRMVRPLLRPEEVVHADYIFGTHDHIDHIDRPSWRIMAAQSRRAVFVVPMTCIDSLSKEIGIDRSRIVGIDDDGTWKRVGCLTVRGIASAHKFLDRNPRTGEHPYLGYVIEQNGRRIYHAGDCCIYEGLHAKLRDCGHLDAVFLPINGRDAKRWKANCIGNMTMQEAVDLAGALDPILAVPGHHDMFKGNRGNPRAFSEYLEVKYPGVQCWTGAHGVNVTVGKCGIRD